MEFHLWLAFAAASTALLLVPGPTVLLILSYAISQGRRVALATAAGVALGDLVAMSASLAGLGALVMASSLLFSLIKWVGAAYLIYLGVRLFRSASGSASHGDLGSLQGHQQIKATAGQVFVHAAAVTALNPKSIVFFIAFVPQFLAPESALMPQFAFLIATFVGLAAANALAYALLGDALRQKIAVPGLLPVLTRLGGGALIAMGCFAALLRR